VLDSAALGGNIIIVMQLILFIGIPGTGKSSFYKERFYRTHLRLNLDMLRTRHREQVLYAACLESKTQVVIDNTNLTRSHRARYITLAREAGYEVHGYFFESRVADAKVRNALREGDERLPDGAIHGASGQLELPVLEEGFDKLWFVKLAEKNQCSVEDWKV
jgi:predicted kinase